MHLQLRSGDITLMSGEQGHRFFMRLKEQLEVVLKGFRVHYHFFVEVPSDEDHVSDPQVPPKEFPFLRDVFQSPRAQNRDESVERVSYIKNMDVKATLYHQMNADMIITTGSSFPLLAATVSPKVRAPRCSQSISVYPELYPSPPPPTFHYLQL